MSDNIDGSTLNQIIIENGNAPTTLTDIKKLGWDEFKYELELNQESKYKEQIDEIDYSPNHEFFVTHCRKGRIIILWKVEGKHLSCSKIYKYSKEFVKSKLCINEIPDKDKSYNPKDKPKVYINEISNNQCVVIQSEYCLLFNLEKGKIIEYPEKIGNKIKKDNEGKETPKLMMLRRSNKDKKKYKIYSMEYNSNADNHYLELLDTHNIYSDETPKIYYDDNHFLAAASHSLISEWNYCYKSYHYEKNFYLKYNDYIVLNKRNKAEEALMVADYRRNSKLVVYSLERNITVSSFEFKEEVHIKKVDFVYVDNGTFGLSEEIKKFKLKNYKIYYMSQQLYKMYNKILANIEGLKPPVDYDKNKKYQTISKLIKKKIKDLIANNEYKGLYANPIIEDGKDYKWTITHNKEFQRINIRVLNKDKKNSNSGSEYDSEYDLSHDETFIKCKLFHDGLILITTNYIQIFAVDDEKKLIYVRYIKSHNLSIESLKKNIKSIEKDYEVIDKIEKVEENINHRFGLLNNVANQDQVKEKIEEIEKNMNKLLNGGVRIRIKSKRNLNKSKKNVNSNFKELLDEFKKIKIE
nr:13717_t:CDS:2 [Entrophospora candida]